MEVNYSYPMISCLNQFFLCKRVIQSLYVGHNNQVIGLNNCNFNPVFLRVSNPQNGGVYEVPSLVNDVSLRGSLVRDSIGDFVIPLSVISSQSVRTSNSIFKYFFGTRSTSCYLGLRKAITGKGEIYYGAPGLILNSNFEPLIIGIQEFDESNPSTISRNILKINPNVFTSDGLLEKTIVKKLIPYYTIPRSGAVIAQAEINDINKYIVKPISPKKDVQKSLKDIIHIYKDEILQDIL